MPKERTIQSETSGYISTLEEGYTETLKLVKRLLERTLLENVGLEKVLKRNILETFLDWNFGEDMGYIIFVLDSDSGSRK